MNSYKNLILAVVLLPAAASVLAQAPPDSQPVDRAVTIGVIRNPDATSPEEIVRKIPAPQPRKRGTGTDESGTELANPHTRTDQGGIPGPGTPDPVVPTVPFEPGDTGT